jgi:hypothetical protein
MTITVEAFTGSAVTIGTTENSMTTNTAGPDVDTTSGIFQAFVDLNALAAGDAFQFKVYEKTITGGTQRAVYTAQFGNAQNDAIWVSPTLILGVGWDMTLKKLSGTDRAITWRISKVA